MKWNDPTRVRFVWVLTPRARGSKITNIAIALECGARWFRPFGHLFLYVFVRGSSTSRAAAFPVHASGDVDALGKGSITAIQRGKYTFRHYISSFYLYVPPCSYIFYFNRSMSAFSVAESRLPGRLMSGLAPLARAAYSSRLLGLRLVYNIYSKGIDNGFYPFFTIRIFGSQYTSTNCGVNITSHGPETWEIVLMYEYLLHLHY